MFHACSEKKSLNVEVQAVQEADERGMKLMQHWEYLCMCRCCLTRRRIKLYEKAHSCFLNIYTQQRHEVSWQVHCSKNRQGWIFQRLCLRQILRVFEKQFNSLINRSLIKLNSQLQTNVNRIIANYLAIFILDYNFYHYMSHERQ